MRFLRRRQLRRNKLKNCRTLREFAQGREAGKPTEKTEAVQTLTTEITEGGSMAGESCSAHGSRAELTTEILRTD